ncbi:MAG TPA: glycogen debranching enzyme GlgX, partial [Pseudonocardiaceae bacterium]|nr:glycogen debranching enzyme GlgX [Pseudonocardiaceae bacterium]
VWLRAVGSEMTEADWFDEQRRAIGMWIDGSDVRLPDGTTLSSTESWLLVLHAGHSDVVFTLPDASYGQHYHLVLDTCAPDTPQSHPTPVPAGTPITLPTRSLRLYRTTQ